MPGHDEWPTYGEFRTAGRRELWEAIARHGGPAVWAQFEQAGLGGPYHAIH